MKTSTYGSHGRRPTSHPAAKPMEERQGQQSYAPPDLFITSSPAAAAVQSSALDVDAVVVEDEEAAGMAKEWTAQIEPGVQITFVSLPGTGAGNDLKRIRFSREMYNKQEAQRWWGENYDRIMELYNVHTFSIKQQQAMEEEAQLEEEEAHRQPGNANPAPTNGGRCHDSSSAGGGCSSGAACGRLGEVVEAEEEEMTSDGDEWTEWVEEDEAGVSITIREHSGGSRELRRIRFSREVFGEQRAKEWWEENRERIHAHYL